MIMFVRRYALWPILILFKGCVIQLLSELFCLMQSNGNRLLCSAGYGLRSLMLARAP